MQRTSRRTARRPARKGGLRPGHGLVAGRSYQQAPRTDRRSRPTSRVAHLGRQHQLHDDGWYPDRRCSGPLRSTIADKGYDTKAIRAAVTALGAEVVIPSPLSRKRLSHTNDAPIACATWSSDSGACSRTGVASPRDTTRLPPITSPTLSFPQPLYFGAIESGT